MEVGRLHVNAFPRLNDGDRQRSRCYDALVFRYRLASKVNRDVPTKEEGSCCTGHAVLDQVTAMFLPQEIFVDGNASVGSLMVLFQ